MLKLFLFLKKIHFVLLFILLEALAIHYYANSTSYTKVKLVTASNYVVGGIYSQLSVLSNYLHLRSENDALAREVADLRNRLEQTRPSTGTLAVSDSMLMVDSSALSFRNERFEYRVARVVNNSIVRQENYISLNKGVEDSIAPDMALISDGGIVGYVLGCSDHFAVCMSVLNRNFKTSGRIKGTDYFGSVYWDGSSYEHVTLSELPKYAPIEVGDTIVTTDYSSIFPPDVLIGTVESFTLRNATFFDVKVRLHTDVTALGNVLVVRYMDAEERKMLEESVLGGGDATQNQ